jgi:hypothetical protein
LLLRAAVAVAAALPLLGPSAAFALELVPGGYGAPPPEMPGAATLDGAAPADAEAVRGAAGLSLDFTPRHGAGLLPPGAAAAEGPRFDLIVRGGDDAFEQLGLGQGNAALRPGSRGIGRGSMIVGGAMRWAGWSLGGGVGRAGLLGTDMDLVSASVGYGRLSAELAFGQSVDYPRTRGDVLMLSTDLAAWSWLTLESDLALGSAPANADRQDGSVAVGRVGLRLNF